MATTTARPAAPARPGAAGPAAARGRLHPLGWWAWAGGVAVALTRTTNPAVVVLLAVAVVLVVAVQRDDSPWARAFGAYLVLGGVVIAVRLLFHVLVGVDDASPVVLDLPGVPLPDWAVGVELLGPVHLAGVLDALYGGLRLAALIVAFGAANALANPKRALRSLPASLHHLGTAVVIAVTVTPQLAAAVGRVRRAQRLRGMTARGPRAAVARFLPVLQDALDHALALAASMDSRGYARTTTPGGDRRVGAALVVGLLAGVLGTYGLLDGAAPDWTGPVLLAVGAAVAVLASAIAGRRVRRTRYRPDPWRAEEWAVAGSGALAAACVLAGGALEPTAMAAAVSPPAWPTLPLAGALAAVAAAAPAFLRPRSVR